MMYKVMVGDVKVHESEDKVAADKVYADHKLLQNNGIVKAPVNEYKDGVKLNQQMTLEA